MLAITLLAFLCVSASADDDHARSSSDNGEYGGTDGKPFSHSVNQLEGPITAIRVRADKSYITGLQARYSKSWGDYVGGKHGDLKEISLYPGESVIKISGKHDDNLRKLVFLTNRGRLLSFGRDTGTSFSAAPLHPNMVLQFISGRADDSIRAIGLHWGINPGSQDSQ
ncbi:zymogen granule membrane protein 16-like [Meriones unguiculatus]|uniref:zymogen granule membrane protein 16-like n=1 Tax=Meriones unguiculatus TaxID=10047 RepID=UPI000B4F86E4|nr:zymogen granule membrane protein 16-like [Meriones unguiculatus]XP_021518781.1 zymogen granule membrane protein 16-like [Meriones unguiculatus]